MIMKTTSVFSQLVKAAQDNRYLILYGGSSSSKTISVLQYLTLYALKHDNTRITLTSESIPVMKKTLIADLRDVVLQDAWDDKSYNKSDLTYRFSNGSIFNFVPADDESRFKGPRQHIFFADEVNHIKQSVYDQADIRTDGLVITTFNPTARFWLADRFDDDRTWVNHSTVNDNKFVSQDIIDALKKRADTDPNFFRVFYLGEWGSLAGLVFKEGQDWQIVNEEIHGERSALGLDFGWSSPSALVRATDWDNKIYAEEIFYKKHLVTVGDTQPSIEQEVKSRGIDGELIIADRSSPTAINELKAAGLKVLPSNSNKDSINTGIKLIKSKGLLVDSESLNLIKELRNYSWAKDKDGVTLEKPVDDFNHAIDGLRYSASYLFDKAKQFTV